MTIHLIFDLLAWSSAIAIRRYSRGYLQLPDVVMTSELRIRYYLVLLIGAATGALLGGSLNVMQQYPTALGHSVLGGIVGATLTVELFKWVHKIDASTGAVWVLPLAVGIAIGRWGCFLAGLADYTYGIPTTLPWGVDFGDGITRHPVQLYESLAMLVFALFCVVLIVKCKTWFSRNGFYLFSIYYAGQRFVWEFLKPYTQLIGPFNLFHFLCIVLAAYGLLMLILKRTR